MGRIDDGWALVSDGPFEGWSNWAGDPFETLTGPFLFRFEEDGGARGAFVPEARHCNGGGIVHGGALMTFADAFLGALLYDALDGQFALTVTFSSEFLGAGIAGSTVYASGRVLRETKSMAFVQGQLEQNDQPVLAFSAVLKKITPR